MREGTRRKGARVGLPLLRSRCSFTASLTACTHKCLTWGGGLDLNVTLPFWKPNFAEWDPDPKVEAVGRRLTALVLDFLGDLDRQDRLLPKRPATLRCDNCDRLVDTEHPANRCALPESFGSST